MAPGTSTGGNSASTAGGTQGRTTASPPSPAPFLCPYCSQIPQRLLCNHSSHPSSSSPLIQLRLIFTPFPPTMKRLSSGSPVTMCFLCLLFSTGHQTSSYFSRCHHLRWLHAFTSPVWSPLLTSRSHADTPSRHHQVAAQNEHLSPNPPVYIHETHPHPARC